MNCEGAAIIAEVGPYPETRAGAETALKREITADREAEFLRAKGWL
jgi:hypothetical protein